MGSVATTISARARRAAHVAGRGLVALLLLLTLAALAVTFLPSAFGYQRYVLVGGSMEPTIHRGSLVFSEVVPVSDLATGDVITYIPPGHTQAVTHRVISSKLLKGQRVFRTKGDNNAVPDMREFKLARPQQARYSFSIPYLGFVFILLGTPSARLILLALPAVLIALAMLANLWREGGRLVATEHEAA